jgi:hypothetical protein
MDYIENYHQTTKMIELYLIFENKSGPKDIKSIYGPHEEYFLLKNKYCDVET